LTFTIIKPDLAFQTENLTDICPIKVVVVRLEGIYIATMDKVVTLEGLKDNPLLVEMIQTLELDQRSTNIEFNERAEPVCSKAVGRR
jgi:hypothetical protein